MRLIDSHRLPGPNIYTSRPVAVARLELDGLTGQETSDCPGFARRLTDALPGLAGHHCAAGRPGGFLDALASPADPVLLTYETLAPVRELLDSLGATAWTGGPAQPPG